MSSLSIALLKGRVSVAQVPPLGPESRQCSTSIGSTSCLLPTPVPVRQHHCRYNNLIPARWKRHHPPEPSPPRRDPALPGSIDDSCNYSEQHPRASAAFDSTTTLGNRNAIIKPSFPTTREPRQTREILRCLAHNLIKCWRE